MRRLAFATLAALAFGLASPARAEILKSATTLAPGSLMISAGPSMVFHRGVPSQFLTGLFLVQGCVGLIKDWDLVFQAGYGPNMPPFVGARVEAPLVQDQAGQPGVAFGLGAHYGYPSGVNNDSVPVPGYLSFDGSLILSEGFGEKFVVHAGLTYSFLLLPGDETFQASLALGAQYAFTPRISLLAEAGFNATELDRVPRYVTIAVVIYAL